MTQEDRLFDLIGSLPDDLACQTEVPKKKRHKISPKSRNRWIGIGVAACLVAAFVGWGMNSYHPSVTLDDSQKSETDLGLPGNDIPSDSVEIDLPRLKLDWPKIKTTDQIVSESALRFAMLPVGNRRAEYHQVEHPGAIPEAYRPQYLGDPYENEDGWYRTADTAGLRYLLHQEEDGSYTLWEFSSFVVNDQLNSHTKGTDFSPYSYAEVLETIYGITSAEDIISVTVNPANMDNTDAGKKLQKKIGSFLTAKRDDINVLYEALSGMTCYGSHHWDLIDLGDNNDSDGLLESVRVCRYLTVETVHGTFSTLKYSAAGGQFYEYSGIAYAPLDEETAAQMNKMFKIELE